MKIQFFLIYLFLSCLFLNPLFSLPIEERLKNAERLRKASLFDASISTSNELLRHFENKFKGHLSESERTLQAIRLSLAKAYFQIENYQQSIEIVKEHLDNIDAIVLTAISLNQLKKYRDTLLITSSKDLQNNDQINFERAYANFHLNSIEDAKEGFNLLLASEFEDLRFLSKIYLARIDLIQLDLENTHQHLSELAEILPKDHPLQYELFYLQAEAFFLQHDYEKATIAFEKAIPKRYKKNIGWYVEVQRRLGWSYLKAAVKTVQNKEQAFHLFEKAENSFKNMEENESFYLSLGACYLSRAHLLKDEDAYIKANELLSKNDCFLSDEAKAEAELLRGEATSSYNERDNFYKQLTIKKNQTSLFYAKILYLRGLNAFKEGQSLLGSKNEEANLAFEQASFSLHESARLLKDKDQAMYGSALKYEAMSYAEQNLEANLIKAISILDQLIKNHELLSQITDPDEIYYLQAVVLLKLKAMQDEATNDETIEKSLKTAIELYPKNNFSDSNLNLLATFYYENNDFDKALTTFLQVAADYPKSNLAADALFNAALSLENLNGDPNLIKNLRKRVFTEYPNSEYAAESYFLFYSYQDYIQGNSLAIKHLQGFIELFPKSPFVLNSYYLLGMDCTRNRKTLEGKWVTKRNLNRAIDYFQSLETRFDELYEGRILDSNLDYFLAIRYLAILERGLAHLKIADESKNPKKKIYLDYAETVFLQIINDFKNSDLTYVKFMADQEPYPHFQEESSYWLGHSYVKSEKNDEAVKTFSEMLEKYSSTTTTKGYFLSKSLYELGLLSMKAGNYLSGLTSLKKAEDAAKGKILNSEQKLDLWIQQSLCYRGLKQFDQAILILSKVINDDTISGLRLKAMFLRSEMYELQGRLELARKQLEALSKKGGEWALEAKTKLEKEYGY